MRLLIQSAMIFFGTLLAAGLLALGEPQATDLPGERERADAGFEHLVLEGGYWGEPAGGQSAR